MIAGAHGGVSVGPDGATHQALEDLFAMCGLPNMSVVVPCDAVETRKATDYLLLEHEVRSTFASRAKPRPIVTDEKTPFVFGQANVIRLRRDRANFSEAFETVLGRDYRGRGRRPHHHRLRSDGSGSDARRLDSEAGVRLRDPHPQPAHAEADRRRGHPAAARETGVIVTAEEHQIGALAWRVSSVITESPVLYGLPVITGAIGVKDRFGDSGAPWELIKEFEVSAEHIAQKAVELMGVKKAAQEVEHASFVGL